MRTNIRITILISVLAAGIMTVAHGQGVSVPLTIQKFDNAVTGSARARGMGSAATAAGNDATAMFSNPAGLLRLTGADVRIGGLFTAPSYEQTQQWNPNRLYAELSLLLENRLGEVVNRPDNATGSDTLIRALQHSYDAIGPNWTKHTSAARPASIAAATPFEIFGVSLAAGAGYSEVVNLDAYFQNNNALNPNIGRLRPEPIERLTKKGDTLKVQWYQTIAQREGGIRGISPSLAFGIGGSLSVGVTATILTGSTDDREVRTERGRINLLAQSTGSFTLFTIDSIAGRLSKTGTSDYSGTMLTLGALWNAESYSVGVTVKPGYTIERSWKRTATLDSMGAHLQWSESGTDKLKLPASFTLGLALRPSDRVTVALDYERRNYADARYTAADSTGAPWINNQVFRVGAEYAAAPWLMLRAGYRQDMQSFAAEGTALLDEPVNGSVVTAGVGLALHGVTVNIAYEYTLTKYYDAWESNTSYNTLQSHNVTVELGYTF